MSATLLVVTCELIVLDVIASGVLSVDVILLTNLAASVMLTDPNSDSTTLTLTGPDSTMFDCSGVLSNCGCEGSDCEVFLVGIGDLGGGLAVISSMNRWALAILSRILP